MKLYTFCERAKGNNLLPNGGIFMKKVTRFLAVIGSIAVAFIGCFLFADGFNLLFSDHMLVNMAGAAFLLTGVYDFVIGYSLLVKVLSGKTGLEINYYDHHGKDEDK